MSYPMVLISGDRDLPDGYGYLHEPSGRVFRFDKPWACDNGAFSGFDEGAFLSMLGQCPVDARCLFIAMPDVVGEWARTLALWRQWSPMVRALGYPLAVVLQDGATVPSVPWDTCDAVFVGGSTRFKESPGARTIMSYALARGKWVHMGRVNGRTRYRYAAGIGVQSVDGSSFSRFPDTVIAKAEAWKQEPIPRDIPSQLELTL